MTSVRGFNEKARGMDSRLQQHMQWVEDYLNHTEDHRQREDEAYKYRHGIQWTKDDAATVKSRGQPVLTFDHIGPKIGSLLGQEIIGRTDPKAHGRNIGDDEKAADVITAAIRFVTSKNQWDEERGICRDDYFTRGTCGIEVTVDFDRPMRSGNPSIVVRYIPRDRIFWDVHSRFRDFRDAKFIGHVIWQDLEDARAEFRGNQHALDILETIPPTDPFQSAGEQLDDLPASWISADRRRIRRSTIWYREGSEWMTATYTAVGYLDGPRRSPFVDDDGRTIPGLILRSCYIRSDNERYGIVLRMIDPQDSLNKRHSKSLHLMNTRMVIADTGAVDNIDQAREELHKPSGWVTKNRGKQLELVDHQTQVVNNFEMLQDAKRELEEVGPSEALIGNAGPGASGAAIQRRQQASLMKFGDAIEGMRNFELHVYRHVWYRIRQYWRAADIFNITDDPRAPQNVGMNRPVTLRDELMSQGQDPQALVAAEQSGVIPPGQLDTVIRIENDIARMDMDILLDTGPDVTTLRQEQWAVMSDLIGRLQLPPQLSSVALEIMLELAPVDSRIKRRFLDALRPDPQRQQAEAAAAMQQQQIQQQATALQIQKLQAEIAKIMADARKSDATAESEEAQAAKFAADAASTAAEIGAQIQDLTNT